MYEIGSESKHAYIKNLVTAVFVFAAAYATAYFLFGEPFSIPGGSCFALVLVWVLGHVGGFVAVQNRTPALLGMLIMGCLFQNLPGQILRGYKHSWASKVKSFGLATILMRAGLKINYTQALKQAPLSVILLGVLPVFAEGTIDTIIFWGLYSMPFLMAGTAGFLLSAISPTVIVTGMLDLQKRGYGHEKNIPSTGMAAAGLDVVCGIAMFSIFESLALQQAEGSVGSLWEIAKGPAGVGLGWWLQTIGGMLCGCTKVFRTTAARTALVFALGQMYMFIYYQYGMPGAGALASIGTAGAAAVCWIYGFPGPLSVGASDGFRMGVDEHLATFWMYVMQPLLFCTIGASINFQNISANVLPKALVVICSGSVLRALSAFTALLPSGWDYKERAFMACCWIAKATMQGALSSAPLDAIQNSMDRSNPSYLQYEAFGYEILATAVLSIFVTAPIALLVISLAAPKLLKKKEKAVTIAPPLGHPPSPRHIRSVSLPAGAAQMTLVTAPSLSFDQAVGMRRPSREDHSSRDIFWLQMEVDGHRHEKCDKAVQYSLVDVQESYCKGDTDEESGSMEASPSR